MKRNTEELKKVEEFEQEIFEVEPRAGLLKRLGWKRISLIILVIVAVLGVYFSFHYYNKYRDLKTNPDSEVSAETQKLVSVLGKLMELPQGELPTIATISDKDKLKDQIFFAKAENGDILFAYTTAMKAILYRPSTNKIINVAPISINQPQDLTSTTKKVTATSTKKQ
jgi:hypothetical protein